MLAIVYNCIPQFGGPKKETDIYVYKVFKPRVVAKSYDSGTLRGVNREIKFGESPPVLKSSTENLKKTSVNSFSFMRLIAVFLGAYIHTFRKWKSWKSRLRQLICLLPKFKLGTSKYQVSIIFKSCLLGIAHCPVIRTSKGLLETLILWVTGLGEFLQRASNPVLGPTCTRVQRPKAAKTLVT